MSLSSVPIRLRFSIDLAYSVHSAGADFIFNIQAAHTPGQQVIHESLQVGPAGQAWHYTDPATYSRFLRLRADAGPLSVHYDAVVDVAHYRAEPFSVAEIGISDLPANVLPYLYPSRYCESDRLIRFATSQFGNLQQGYSRVQAICDWVAKHVAFQSNTTSGTTSACDTLVEKQGVCRDFAHLMIALCRAVNIPARFATGIDYGADPGLGPQDFHAYVEIYLSGRWFIFDPSGTALPMGFIRLATGRDAADAAFATIFGSVYMNTMRIDIEPIAGADGVLREPTLTAEALSTDDGI